jgi:hypothetical protein|tara:strand:- start:5 stop:256 length:252 start_codon:yes stop_codon:yes gene_type:complete
MSLEEPVVDEIVDAEEEAEEEELLEEEEEFVAAGATEVKLFGKWSFDDIEIRDISLEVSAVDTVISLSLFSLPLSLLMLDFGS